MKKRKKPDQPPESDWNDLWGSLLEETPDNHQLHLDAIRQYEQQVEASIKRQQQQEIFNKIWASNPVGDLAKQISDDVWSELERHINSKKPKRSCDCGAFQLGVEEHSGWCLKGRGIK